MLRIVSLLALSGLVLMPRTASAHISYNNRNLGTFEVVGTTIVASGNSGVLTNSGTSASVTITNQNTLEHGWADGTDARFGDSHDLRPYRFTLSTPAIVTINVVGLDYVAGPINFASLEHPAFSLYEGFAHLPPDALDHDGSALSLQWMQSQVGAGNFDGNFNALGDWKIGSDDSVTFADLSSFRYIGNAADGTSTNYGSAVGINGDGNADGSVTATFYLAAGDYTLFVGGGNYGGTSSSSYGYETTFTVVPEPTAAALAGVAIGILGLRRRVARM
jgi:hypothetical protein